MRLYGLIGNPLLHSFSKKYFTQKFLNENVANTEYLNFEIDSIDQLPELLTLQPGLAGFNVTRPYKESILKYITNLEGDAIAVQVVNTVVVNRTKEKIDLTGYNTDLEGIRHTIQLMPMNKIKGALVCGGGGAGKAARHVLKNMSIDSKLLTRTGAEYTMMYTDVNADIMNKYNLIINCTPVGSFPDTDKSLPLPYHFMNGENIFFDMVYNPQQTASMKLAASHGALTINGYDMLVTQAEASWQIWQQSLLNGRQ